LCCYKIYPWCFLLIFVLKLNNNYFFHYNNNNYFKVKMNNRVNLPVKNMYHHMKFHQNFIFSIDIKYVSSTKKKKKGGCWKKRICKIASNQIQSIVNFHPAKTWFSNQRPTQWRRKSAPTTFPSSTQVFYNLFRLRLSTCL